MIDDEDSPQLTPREREALRALSRERQPAAELEGRVIEALAARGLIRRRRRPGSLWAVAAAAVLALSLGFLTGRWSVATAPAEGESPRFMLLLYDTPEREVSRSPERNRELAAEYGGWARELGRAGRFVGGDPLQIGGRMLRQAGQRVVAGPETAAGGEIVVGYFMIRARDYDEALEIAEGCPHLRYEGSVLVRRVGHT